MKANGKLNHLCIADQERIGAEVLLAGELSRGAHGEDRVYYDQQKIKGECQPPWLCMSLG